MANDADYRQFFIDRHNKQDQSNLDLRKLPTYADLTKQHNLQNQMMSDSDLQSTSFDQFRKTKEQDIEKFSLEDLRNFASALQHEIKKCSLSQPLNPDSLQDQTL